MHTFKNAVSWFEIPVKDIARAKQFYEQIFEAQLQSFYIENVLQMALFPVSDGSVGGALVENQKFYHSSHEGPLVYLNGNPDLQAVVDRIEEHGGKILIAKRQISPERGYMAVFEDSEGNRVALHSSR
ncbi:MAG: VOC family protein [Ignavibacteriae bacterium]|nr:VOC family protein [Ignavibacteriota bacterium]